MSFWWNLKTRTAEAEMCCMNVLPLSRLVQNLEAWHSYLIWVMDGQSWPISGQKRKGIPHGFSLLELLNPYTDKCFLWKETFIWAIRKKTYLQTAVLSSFECTWVVHLNRFYFWYESFIRCFLKQVPPFVSSFIRVVYMYLKVTLGEHTSYHMLWRNYVCTCEWNYKAK